MKDNTLSYASCIATASNNTSSLHSAMILTHTMACSHNHNYSSQKQNFVIPKMTSEVNLPHSLLILGCEMEKGNFSNFENAYKLYENSNDHFSQWWSGEKGNLY